jgi:hypothetical protein
MNLTLQLKTSRRSLTADARAHAHQSAKFKPRGRCYTIFGRRKLRQTIACLSEYLVTGRLSGQPVIQYLRHSSASLTQTDLAAPMRQMGHTQLLFSYLYNNLGDMFLRRLLSSNMDGFQDVDSSIPRENVYHWQSFQNAFRDFQIAKFDEANRMRYFLFATTIQTAFAPEWQSNEWSAIEFKTLADMLKSQKPLHLQFEDFAIVDDPSLPVLIAKPGPTLSTQPANRYFRVIFDRQ